METQKLETLATNTAWWIIFRHQFSFFSTFSPGGVSSSPGGVSFSSGGVSYLPVSRSTSLQQSCPGEPSFRQQKEFAKNLNCCLSLRTWNATDDRHLPQCEAEVHFFHRAFTQFLTPAWNFTASSESLLLNDMLLLRSDTVWVARMFEFIFGLCFAKSLSPPIMSLSRQEPTIPAFYNKEQIMLNTGITRNDFRPMVLRANAINLLRKR